MIDHEEAPLVAWQDACPACGTVYEPGVKGGSHDQL